MDFWEWVEEINWYTYWNAMYVLVTIINTATVTSDLRYVVMIAMVLHALNSLLSAYGAFSESRAVLIGSLVLRCFG